VKCGVQGASERAANDTSGAQRWPSVTVVVPTIGERADVLEQTLEGIRGQGYPGSVECIIVLDRRSPDAQPDASPGSSDYAAALDATRAVAAAWGCRLIDNSRTPGLAGTRNSGILAATGELVAFCDDDDRWLPGKLQAQVLALGATPRSTLACCGITVEYGDTLVERVHDGAVVTFRELLRSRLMALHVSTFLARREALLDGVGLVCEELPGSRYEDYELLLRAARYTPIVNVPKPLVHVMWHTERRAMYGRWPLVVQALPWLLDRYPEFRTEPVGYARLAGQMSFAAAAAGDRALAWRWVRRTIRVRPREPRAYIALAVMSGAVNPDRVIRWLRRRGRGL
jgi:cellulose synthase/poly-beta-1,6-N-acetylglucosamine synthase-like glycosyltransferase